MYSIMDKSYYIVQYRNHWEHQREHLYEHDVGLSRLRKVMVAAAQKQLSASP